MQFAELGFYSLEPNKEHNNIQFIVQYNTHKDVPRNEDSHKLTSFVL